MDIPETLVIIAVGAFVLGWLVAKISAWLGNRLTSGDRDPRDDRIRSLEADLRVARGDAEKTRATLEEKDRELAAANRQLGEADIHLIKQEELIVSLKNDLRDSVRKTRELREELKDRATENLKSEVRLREVQTELSVAQASTDLLATGVLDYSVAPDPDEEEAPAVRQSQQ